MPTLKEFIATVLKNENLQGDVNKIALEIEKEARKKAVSGIACICDEEVREMTINIAELMLKNPGGVKKTAKTLDKEEVKEPEKVVEKNVAEKPVKVQEPKKEEVKEEPKEEAKEEEPKKIAKGTFGKEMIVINVEQESLF